MIIFPVYQVRANRTYVTILQREQTETLNHYSVATTSLTLDGSLRGHLGKNSAVLLQRIVTLDEAT